MANMACNGDSTTCAKTWADFSGAIPSTQLPGGTPTGSGPVVMATSPVLTTPTLQAAPTAGDNSLLVASTSFVKAQNYITSAGAPVQSVAGRTGAIILAEADVTNLVSDLAAKAPLASPALTGVPTAPTALAADNSTTLATTAFVKSQGYSTGGTATKIDLTAQVATITNATLLAAGSVQTGIYRLSGWTKKTTAATTSSTSGPLTLSFTDGTDSSALTSTMALLTSAGAIATTNATNSVAVAASNTIVPFTFFAKSGVAITYSFTYASSGATAMQFELHLRLEFLG